MLTGSGKIDNPWFQEWFDSPYYHLLYQDRDESEAEYFLSNLLKYLQLSIDSRILDMACGNGRHAAYLADQGYEVVGFDIADAQIKAAKHKARSNLRFFKHDMQKPFQLGKFDLILNLFTSFGYFEEDETHQQVLNNVASSLNPGGLLVLDFMNVHYILNNLKPTETQYRDGVTFYINRYPENGFVKKRILVDDHGRFHHFKEKVRALELENFEEYLKEANFTIQKLFGNYDLDRFDPGHSERLIIIAEKQGHA